MWRTPSVARAGAARLPEKHNGRPATAASGIHPSAAVTVMMLRGLLYVPGSKVMGVSAPVPVASPPSFVSVSEAAISLHVSSATIRRWIRSGSLQAVQPGAPQGAFRIAESELVRLAEAACR
jgi:excisionase family DNA binding protein